jgi:hypothetical protein
VSNAVTNSVRNAVVTLYARSTRPRPVPSYYYNPPLPPRRSALVAREEGWG